MLRGYLRSVAPGQFRRGGRPRTPTRIRSPAATSDHPGYGRRTNMPRLRPPVVVLLGVGLLAVGCGKGTATGVASSRGSVSPATAPKPLPAEYRTLAENLSQDLRPSTDQFRDDQPLSAIIAEGYAGIM